MFSIPETIDIIMFSILNLTNDQIHDNKEFRSILSSPFTLITIIVVNLVNINSSIVGKK